MVAADITLDNSLVKCGIDDRLYGSFIEHIGRAVYGGIYEPGHPAADEDGVGPAHQRPRRLDLAWRSVESNAVGPNEFARWARKAGTGVIMAVNLGTRGIEDARNLVEYCNHPQGTYWSDLRRSHGASEPHGFEVWCLGNEMDGPWQVGYKNAEEYGRLAAQVGKALKRFDPSLELVACGSSSMSMPTCPQWEATVLEHCCESVDYISLHNYAKKQGEDQATFPAESLVLDRFIDVVANTADFVEAKLQSPKTLMLSFDEWNVWYHTEGAEIQDTPWEIGPRLLEDVYTFEDALVVGGCLIALLRHADRVRIACLAQLVNAIAPIMTENGGPAWRQTIFFPFLTASRYGRGEALETDVRSPAYHTSKFGDVPFLDAMATLNAKTGELSLFCLNRSADQPMDLKVRLGGFGKCRAIEHIVLTSPDPKAVNSREAPNTVLPRKIGGDRIEGEMLQSVLPALSWNVIRIGLGSPRP